MFFIKDPRLILLAEFLLIAFQSSDAWDCVKVNELPTTAQDSRLLTPWVASIFKKDPITRDWEYHCGGTITAPYVVITSASCVTKLSSKSYEGVHYKYTDLRIVAGLPTTNYYNRDTHTQEMEIGMIREHKVPLAKSATGYVQNYGRPANLAGIRLKFPFKLTPYVQTVCVVEVPNSVEELLTLSPGEKVIIGGFDHASPVHFLSRRIVSLNLFQFELLDPVSCLKKYPSQYRNVVCGKLIESEQLTTFPCKEGSGLVASTDGERTGVGKMYLMGVYTGNTATMTNNGYPYPVSNETGITSCSRSETAFFTKHGEHYRWALSNQFCDVDLLQCQSDNCRPLEELCDGKAQCADGTDESPEVCLNQFVCKEGEFRCDYGVCVDELKVCDGMKDCADGSDEADEEKCREADIKRNVTCPPIELEKEVESRCFLSTYLGGSSVSCSENALPVGTRVDRSCKRYYVLEQGFNVLTSICQRTGEWSNSNEKVVCKPSCGISESTKLPFLVGGQNVTTRGEWPWHVSIYLKHQGTFSLICGGTLISTRLILTAAHCLTFPFTSTVRPSNDIRVLFGNLVSDFRQSTTVGDEFVQQVEIESIIIHDYYNFKSLETDIALIVLKKPIEISLAVRPICLTTDEKLIHEQFTNANPMNGTKLAAVVGFGVDESKRISNTLKQLRIPIIPKQQCEESLIAETHTHIKFTWLCAGYTNGSTVCNGDSGGGLFLPLDAYGIGRKYYIQGIVSHGVKTGGHTPSCNVDTYKIFTQVSRFMPWIQEYLDKYV